MEYSPVPEPSTIAIVVVAGLAIVWHLLRAERLATLFPERLMNNRRVLLATLISFAVGSQAMAAVTTYPHRAAWTAAAGTPTGGENFNGFTQDVSTRNATVTIHGGTVGSVVTDQFFPDRAYKVDVSPFEYDSYVVDGSPFFLADAADTRVVIFGFRTPITAWAADFGRGSRFYESPITHARIQLFNDNPEQGTTTFLGSIPISDAFTFHEIQFYGFTISGGAANRMVIRTVAGPGVKVFGIDNIQFVTVPEPSTFIAAATAIFTLAAFRRRA